MTWGDWLGGQDGTRFFGRGDLSTEAVRDFDDVSHQVRITAGDFA